MWFRDTNRRYEQSITIAAFLGGLMLTVLALLIPLDSNPVFCMIQPNNQTSTSVFCKFIFSIGWAAYYKQLLIGFIGTVGTLLILSIFGMKVAYVQNRPWNYTFTRVSLGFYEAGFVGIVILLLFLVFPFSLIGGFLILFIIAGWGLMLLFQSRFWKGRLAGTRKS